LLEKQTDLQYEIEEYQQKEQQAKIALAAAEQAIQELNEKVLAKNYDVSQKMSSYNEQNQIFYARQNQLNAILQEISFQENNWQQNKSRAAQQEAELSQTQAAIQALLQTSEVGEDELIQLYEEQKNIEAGVAEAEKEYYAWRGRNDNQEKEIREIQRKKEQSAQLFMEVQNKQNEVNLHLNNIIERVGVEFGIEIKEDEILDYEGSLYSEEQLKEKVKDLRQKIDKIGPINSMAMEAYKEIKERYDFIVAQREDLIQAKQSLLQTIEEIDTVAKENFLNTFHAIREHFMRVFRSLFTEEDTCDLRLVDENNPLDSAIDIIARPKGKRPLTINQLSGGEKTLTATALLFSIYLIKPAPFCIFDEVDAPLDDANVDKFNKLIRKFSENSQFIIVTHNKRTMASTDVIYGVTMLEEGVSRVIPVDIKNYADE
jgi:chromosome segregation protein